MNSENRFNHSVSSGSSPSHPPLPSHIDNDVRDHTRHPKDLSFLGPLPLSHNQAIHNFGVWNCSAQGGLSSQPLQGPGQASPLPPSLPDRPLPVASHKCKQAISPEPAAVGGYGPISGSQESDGVTMDLLPTIKFTGQKNSTYDIWLFIRALRTDEDLPPELWPNDYNQHLTERPDAPFVGCKLCTEFG